MNEPTAPPAEGHRWRVVDRNGTTVWTGMHRRENAEHEAAVRRSLIGGSGGVGLDWRRVLEERGVASPLPGAGGYLRHARRAGEMTPSGHDQTSSST